MIKLKSFIHEIKIVPLGLPKTNEELCKFLNKNKSEFLAKIYEDNPYINEWSEEYRDWEDYDFKLRFGEDGSDITIGQSTADIWISLNPDSQDFKDFIEANFELHEMNLKGVKIYYLFG